MPPVLIATYVTAAVRGPSVCVSVTLVHPAPEMRCNLYVCMYILIVACVPK